MNKVNDNETGYKQRFKAVEGFLRRVAFNLGNSPSQTEVKIISCIPIDVTDLQQKIFTLQKQLEEAKRKVPNETSNVNKTSAIHTAICNNTCPTCSARGNHDFNTATCNENFCCNSESLISQGTDTTSKRLIDRSSLISFIYPSSSCENCPHHFEHSSKTSKKKYCNPKNLFSRRKKASKKKQCNTHLVYRAQTDINTPFRNSFKMSNDFTSKNFTKDTSRSIPLSESYLADIVLKQYAPSPPMNGFSNLSDFSSPVCRDNIPTCSQYSPYEPDLCSCCNGQFQNIDDHITTRHKFHEYLTCENIGNFKGNTYYDSNFYDLVPVKEKPVRITNGIDVPKIKESQKLQKPAIKCWPEKVRSKCRVPPTVVNYCTMSPVRDCYAKRFPAKLQNRKDIAVKKTTGKRVKVNPQRYENLPKLFSVDIGPTYTKQDKKYRKQKTMNIRKKRNVSITCLPIANNNADCQTTTTSDENPPENKTERTLDQIKSILQSVLTEVKTSTKLTRPITKKDAVVQNGPSQGNLFGTSQFLQSYTYSPYKMAPCLQPISSNFAYSSLQGRYLQQYPLLIQPQKHMCTNCVKSNQVNLSDNTKRATSAGTNTEQAQERSKETEKLIKEIYKSMALNVEMPSSKDNTVGDYAKLESTAKYFDGTKNVESDKETNSIVNAISEIFKNTKPLESTITGNTDTTLTKLTSNEEVVGSKRGYIRNHRMTERMYSHPENINSTTNSTDRELEREQVSRNLESEEQSDDTIVNIDTEQSSSETESDDVVVNVNESQTTVDAKEQKNGLFKKMLKMFKPRQKHRSKDVAKEDQKESESDSDDYQTIYSHKVATPAPITKKAVNARGKPHSKVFHSKQQRRPRARSPELNPRTTPYMEQEYRRHWDERLMFYRHLDQNYSTEASRDTADTPRVRRPVYYQNYEARSALGAPNRVIPRNVLEQRCLVNNYSKVGNYREDHPYQSSIRPNHPGNNSNYSGNRPNYSGNRPDYSGNHPNHEGNGPKYVRNNNYSLGNGNIKPHFITAKNNVQRKNMMSAKGLAWLKRHKLQCGQQWKDLILES